MLEKRVDGMLVQPVAQAHDHLRLLADMKVPFVLIQREVPGLVADAVVTDNMFGAYQAVDHPVELGRRRIAYLTTHLELSPVRDRIEGYRRALVQHDVLYDERLVSRGDLSAAAAAESARAALAATPRPDAIFAYNDLVAIRCLRALRDLGARVPDDVALVGFDDILIAEFFEVPLTTVAQPTQEIGQTATNLLLDRIERGGPHAHTRIVLPPRLVVRASSGAPSRSASR